jgi:hypothetical protein
MKVNYRLLIFTVIALVISVIIAFFVIKTISNNRFNKNVKNATENLIISAYIAKYTTDAYSEIWKKKINAGYRDIWIDGERKYFSDFSEAVRYRITQYKELGILNKMDSTLNLSKQIVQKIDASFFGNKEAKKCMKDFYLNVTEYCSLANSPTGSLQSFNNKTNELSALISKNMKEMELYLPK